MLQQGTLQVECDKADVRVDFWLRTLTHVNFNHVNKREARYKVFRLNVKLTEVLLLRLKCDLSYIASVLFANVNFTNVRT